jgi:hypothetical protein
MEGMDLFEPSMEAEVEAFLSGSESIDEKCGSEDVFEATDRWWPRSDGATPPKGELRGERLRADVEDPKPTSE